MRPTGTPRRRCSWRRRGTEPDDATLERVRGLLAADLRWDVLVEKARFHGVRPLLWWTLSRLDQGAVPAEHLEQLSEAFRANAARGLFMQREAVRVLGVLAEAGVRAGALQGAAPRYAWVYGNVVRRTYTDLDVVVRPADAPRAVEALVADAYVLDDPDEAQHPRQRWHHDLRREDGRVLLELHWTFAPARGGCSATLDAIWSWLETRTVGDDRVTVFGPEDQLAMLTVHGAHHYWLRLLWVCDIAELLRSRPDMDWPSVVQRSRAARETCASCCSASPSPRSCSTRRSPSWSTRSPATPRCGPSVAQLAARMLAPTPVEPEGREAAPASTS